MNPAITQQHDFGCGAACVAFVSGVSYQESAAILGVAQAVTGGFWCRELVLALSTLGLTYEFRYLKPPLRRRIYKEGTIVFVARSNRYPAGHYLARSDGAWMDSWINFPRERNIDEAESGFRRRLPDRPVYALFPL